MWIDHPNLPATPRALDRLESAAVALVDADQVMGAAAGTGRETENKAHAAQSAAWRELYDAAGRDMDDFHAAYSWAKLWRSAIGRRLELVALDDAGETEHVCYTTAGGFAHANGIYDGEDDPDHAALMALELGRRRSWRTGGGAAPLFELRQVTS